MISFERPSEFFSTLLERGYLEVGIGGDMPALTAAARSNVVIMALVQHGFCSTVARRHMLVDQLRGKRIGFAFGSNAHYALLQMLAAAGLNESEVDLVEMEVNAMPAAFAEGRIDAFSAWEPTPAIALKTVEGAVVVHRSLSSGYMYASRRLALRNPPVLREIVASELRALRWLRKNRANMTKASHWALAAVKEFTGQELALDCGHYVALAREDLLGLFIPSILPEADLAEGGRLQREFAFLKSVGKIDAEAEWNSIVSCFDRSISEAVVADPKRYRIFVFEYDGGGG